MCSSLFFKFQDTIQLWHIPSAKHFPKSPLVKILPIGVLSCGWKCLYIHMPYTIGKWSHFLVGSKWSIWKTPFYPFTPQIIHSNNCFQLVFLGRRGQDWIGNEKLKKINKENERLNGRTSWTSTGSLRWLGFGCYARRGERLQVWTGWISHSTATLRCSTAKLMGCFKIELLSYCYTTYWLGKVWELWSLVPNITWRHQPLQVVI